VKARGFGQLLAADRGNEVELVVAEGKKGVDKIAVIIFQLSKRVGGLLKGDLYRLQKESRARNERGEKKRGRGKKTGVPHGMSSRGKETWPSIRAPPALKVRPMGFAGGKRGKRGGGEQTKFTGPRERESKSSPFFGPERGGDLLPQKRKGWGERTPGVQKGSGPIFFNTGEGLVNKLEKRGERKSPHHGEAGGHRTIFKPGRKTNSLSKRRRPSGKERADSGGTYTGPPRERTIIPPNLEGRGEGRKDNVQ